MKLENAWGSSSKIGYDNKSSWEFLEEPHIIGICIILAALPVVAGFTLLSRIVPVKNKLSLRIKKKSSRNSQIFTQIIQPGVFFSWLKLWRKLPRRIWNFYIEALLVPGYRDEWGKYNAWSFRFPDRHYRPPYVKKEMSRIKKQKLAAEKSKLSKIPLPKPHNHFECQRVRFNVNGSIFETQLRTLNKYPHTLLGNPDLRVKFYDPHNDYYYFDRNRYSFEAILNFYQSGGRFRRPENVHLDVFLDDADFYQIPEGIVEKFRFEEGINKNAKDVETPDSFYLMKIWLLFDCPQSSDAAKILALISVCVVILSIVTFCIETLELFNLTNSTLLVGGNLKLEQSNQYHILDPFFFTETACIIWFTMEYVGRFLSSPKKLKFIASWLNLIDLIAICPYYFTIFTQLTSQTTGGSTLSLLRVIRLVRVLRIFKLSRHSVGLKILGRTLQASLAELFLLVFFVFIGIILFSSAMYYAEQSDPDTFFGSIPDGFWFSVITMTTVGYGDIYPRTTAGKLVGSLCALAGVCTIALPVPVIVSNFNYFYHQAIDEQQFKLTRINHVQECPYRPGGYGKDQDTFVCEGTKHETNFGYEEMDSDEFDDLLYKKSK